MDESDVDPEEIKLEKITRELAKFKALNLSMNQINATGANDETKTAGNAAAQEVKLEEKHTIVTWVQGVRVVFTLMNFIYVKIPILVHVCTEGYQKMIACTTTCLVNYMYVLHVTTGYSISTFFLLLPGNVFIF